MVGFKIHAGAKIISYVEMHFNDKIIGTAKMCWDDDDHRNWCFELPFDDIHESGTLMARANTGDIVHFLLPVFSGGWLFRLLKSQPNSPYLASWSKTYTPTALMGDIEVPLTVSKFAVAWSFLTTVRQGASPRGE